MPTFEKRKQIHYTDVNLSLGNFRWTRSPNPSMVYINSVQLKENPRLTLVPFLTQVEKILIKSGYIQFIMNWHSAIDPSPLMKELNWQVMEKSKHDLPQYTLFKTRMLANVTESFGTLLETDLENNMKSVLSGKATTKSTGKNSTFDEELELVTERFTLRDDQVEENSLDMEEAMDIDNTNDEELLALFNIDPNLRIRPVVEDATRV